MKKECCALDRHRGAGVGPEYEQPAARLKSRGPGVRIAGLETRNETGVCADDERSRSADDTADVHVVDRCRGQLSACSGVVAAAPPLNVIVTGVVILSGMFHE